MSELIDYQAQRIEALEKRVKELEEKLEKYEIIIFPSSCYVLVGLLKK